MKPKVRVFAAVAVSVLLLSGFVASQSDIYLKIAKSIDVFGKVYKEVTFNYVDVINPEEFMISGINGMLAALDPYTVFIDEKRKEDIDLITDGKYGGIGVSIGLRNDKITIVDLIDGYSAQRQGLRIGDVILTVNARAVNKENFEDISSLVKGEPGTEVVLTVMRDGGDEQLTFNLMREEIRIKNLVFSDFVPENSGNVYLKLTGFTRTAGDEIRKALADLSAKHPIESVVLDLRGNPGGLLDAAVDVSEKFLKKGQLVVSVMGRDSSSRKTYYSQEEPIAGNARVVLLVDNSSASASEIVAGAIQDHDRGIIVGTPTFGKGLVQTIIPLSYNTSIKITTARYYTPSGRCIQKIDYSKTSKVLQNRPLVRTMADTNYFTDHKRMVHSSGGIKPDTLVNETSEASVVKQLLAKGMFFKFANQFSNLNKKDIFTHISDEKLMQEFDDFVKKEKFEYSTEGEQNISELLKNARDEKYSSRIIGELENLKKQFGEMKTNDMKIHKTEILFLLKSELYSRYDGLSGRLRAMLSNDNQFQKALDILKNDKLYTRLLSNK